LGEAEQERKKVTDVIGDKSRLLEQSQKGIKGRLDEGKEEKEKPYSQS